MALAPVCLSEHLLQLKKLPRGGVTEDAWPLSLTQQGTLQVLSQGSGSPSFPVEEGAGQQDGKAAEPGDLKSA